ncbi:MAG: hypothetical protein ACHQNE_07870 [Candidatus Kapaibacterium sp.]
MSIEEQSGPVEIGFDLIHFKEVSFTEAEDHRNLVPSAVVDFITSVSLHVVDPGSFLTIALEIMAKVKDQENAMPLFQLKTELRVKLRGIQPVDKSGEVSLPAQFLLNLIIIAYASSRGVLSAKTKGTWLEELYLPINNASTLLPTTPPSLQNWFA